MATARESVCSAGSAGSTQAASISQDPDEPIPVARATGACGARSSAPFTTRWLTFGTRNASCDGSTPAASSTSRIADAPSTTGDQNTPSRDVACAISRPEITAVASVAPGADTRTDTPLPSPDRASATRSARAPVESTWIRATRAPPSTVVQVTSRQGRSVAMRREYPIASGTPRSPEPGATVRRLRTARPSMSAAVAAPSSMRHAGSAPGRRMGTMRAAGAGRAGAPVADVGAGRRAIGRHRRGGVRERAAQHEGKRGKAGEQRLTHGGGPKGLGGDGLYRSARWGRFWSQAGGDGSGPGSPAGDRPAARQAASASCHGGSTKPNVAAKRSVDRTP